MPACLHDAGDVGVSAASAWSLRAFIALIERLPVTLAVICTAGLSISWVRAPREPSAFVRRVPVCAITTRLCCGPSVARDVGQLRELLGAEAGAVGHDTAPFSSSLPPPSPAATSPRATRNPAIVWPVGALAWNRSLIR